MPALTRKPSGLLAPWSEQKDEHGCFPTSEKLCDVWLGGSVCTTISKKPPPPQGGPPWVFLIRVFDGAYFINNWSNSDPRLPFGANKKFRLWTWARQDGMMEFINRKDIYIKWVLNSTSLRQMGHFHTFLGQWFGLGMGCCSLVRLDSESWCPRGDSSLFIGRIRCSAGWADCTRTYLSHAKSRQPPSAEEACLQLLVDSATLDTPAPVFHLYLRFY